MARYWRDIQVTRNMEEVMRDVSAYLVGEGFKNVFVRGENVWQKGGGWVSGPQYIKLQTAPGIARIEAWIRFALLPGVYLGEEGIDGFVGAVPKSILKGRVMRIESILSAPGFGAPQAGFCNNCGVQVTQGARFCDKCGTQL